MSITPLYAAMNLIGVSVCGLAIWKGGAGERLGGIAVGAGIVAAPLASLLLPADLIALFYLVADGLIAMALLLATLRYASPWLGGVMLLYAAQFALHSFYFVTDRKLDFFHALFNDVNLIAMLALLTTGTVIAWGRRSKSRPAT